MAILVDSSVLLDILTGDANWYEWSMQQLIDFDLKEELLINEMIWAECSGGFSRIEQYRAVIAHLNLRRESIPEEALFLATKAFINYRRSGGTKSRPLPDFFIGAHAAVKGYTLLTRDPERVRTYFPRVPIRCP